MRKRGRRLAPSRRRRRRRRSATGPRPRSPASAKRPRPASRHASASSTARWTPTRGHRDAPTARRRHHRSFQAEMDAFFERLLAELDPTRIATMAETMPEPPDLAGVAASILEPSTEPFEAWRQGRPPRRRHETAEPSSAVQQPRPRPSRPPTRRPRPRPRWRRLDFAAAEAEALAFAVTSTTTAARRLRTMPKIVVPAEVGRRQTGERRRRDPAVRQGERAMSRVVVVGLVSVASIATFKRGLGATAGVSGGRRRIRSRWRVRLQRRARPGPDLAARSPRCPGSRHASPPKSGGLEVTAHDPDTGD